MAYTSRHEFYRSSEWSKFRQAYIGERLARDGELICDMCGQPIIKAYDAILHHVEELDDVNVFDATVTLNPENIQLLDHRCHNKAHDRWQGGNYAPVKKVMVVWGSPCAGKRAFVDKAAGPRDLIVDIDRLYEALSIGDDRKAVKTNVMNLYRQLMDMVRTRNGRWVNAWIIRTLPYIVDRDRIIKEVDVDELIHIDTPMDECMREAEQRGGEWSDWTEQYWSRFQV